MNIFPFFKRFSSPSPSSYPLSIPVRRLIFWGTYAILCQLSLILLHTQIYREEVSYALLALRFAPMLEHSLMSLTILACGAYLIERTLSEAT